LNDFVCPCRLFDGRTIGLESSLGKGTDKPNFIIFQLNTKPGAQLDVVFESDSVPDRPASLVGEAAAAIRKNAPASRGKSLGISAYV
jgi:hypothetical protein